MAGGCGTPTLQTGGTSARCSVTVAHRRKSSSVASGSVNGERNPTGNTTERRPLVAWIELHQAVWTHRKTMTFAAQLGIRDTYAAAHLGRLWSWALDNAPDGRLAASDSVIARAADWDGDPAVFVAALVDSRWLDQDDEGSLSIHDWDDYAGRLISRRVANTERMRSARASHVQRTNGARAGATGPNRTQPDPTQPDPTGNTPPTPPAGGRSGKRVKPPIVVLTNEHRATLVHDFGPQVGGEHVVAQIIEEALAHGNAPGKSGSRNTDEYLYVRGWLRREAPKVRTNGAGPNGKKAGPPRQFGMVNADGTIEGFDMTYQEYLAQTKP